jgi:hypothetical protein
MTGVRTGSCLCGGVRYEVHGPLRPVVACHCLQCRKQTGTYMSATAANDRDLKIVSGDTLAWFRSSDEAKRGFCNACGSVLFWKGDGRDYTAIAAGSIDGKLDVPFEGHIFCDFAGDYYEIAGGSYRKAAW